MIPLTSLDGLIVTPMHKSHKPEDVPKALQKQKKEPHRLLLDEPIKIGVLRGSTLEAVDDAPFGQIVR